MRTDASGDGEVVVDPRVRRCAACGYDLLGQMATWRDACPLESTCPECGRTIVWRRAALPRVSLVPPPAWSIEHAATWRDRRERATAYAGHVLTGAAFVDLALCDVGRERERLRPLRDVTLILVGALFVVVGLGGWMRGADVGRIAWLVIVVGAHAIATTCALLMVLRVDLMPSDLPVNRRARRRAAVRAVYHGSWATLVLALVGAAYGVFEAWWFMGRSSDPMAWDAPGGELAGFWFLVVVFGPMIWAAAAQWRLRGRLDLPRRSSHFLLDLVVCGMVFIAAVAVSLLLSTALRAMW